MYHLEEVTYSALISACDKVAMWEMALHLLQDRNKTCEQIPWGFVERSGEKKRDAQKKTK